MVWHKSMAYQKWVYSKVKCLNGRFVWAWKIIHPLIKLFFFLCSPLSSGGGEWIWFQHCQCRHNTNSSSELSLHIAFRFLKSSSLPILPKLFQGWCSLWSIGYCTVTCWLNCPLKPFVWRSCFSEAERRVSMPFASKHIKLHISLSAKNRNDRQHAIIG